MFLSNNVETCSKESTIQKSSCDNIMTFTELPYGWEEIKDPKLGRSIYIDHNTGMYTV